MSLQKWARAYYQRRGNPPLEIILIITISTMLAVLIITTIVYWR